MEPKTHFLAVNIKEVDSCVYLTKVVCSWKIKISRSVKLRIGDSWGKPETQTLAGGR